MNKFITRSNTGLNLLITAAAVMLITSCSGSDGDSGSSSSNTTASALEGEWQAPCEPDGDSSSISSISFEGNSFTRTEIIYVGSASCNTGTIFSLEINGSFSLPNGTTTTSQGEAQHIDIVSETVDANSSDAFNAALALEGLTFDQQIQSAFGVADAASITPESISVTSPFFSLVLVDGNTLLFGDEDSNQGNDAETRLTEIDTVQVFTRQ